MSITINKAFFDFNYIVRALTHVLSCSKRLTFLRLILLSIQGILPLIPLYLMKLLLDAFTQKELPTNQYVIIILLGFAAVQVSIILITNLLSYINKIQSDIVTDHVTEILVKKAVEIDLEYFDSDEYHDIYERAVKYSSGKPMAVLVSLSQLVQSIISLLAIVILLFTLHIGIALVLIIIALPIALIRLYYVNKLVALKVSQTQPERRAFYYQRILTNLEFAKEIRVFGFGDYLQNKFSKLKRKLREDKTLIYSGEAKSIGFAQSIEAIAIIIALGYICLRALEGLISVGDIAMYFGAFQKGQTNINTALKSIVNMHENKKYLEHLFAFMDLQKAKVELDVLSKIPKVANSLKFKNVSFIYPYSSETVLHDISFEAKKGELVALVGKNGSGKSTIIKLISRLYDSTDGEILLNDVNIASYTSTDFRNLISVIFQDFSKYNASVSDNIKYSEVNHSLDQNRDQIKIERAANNALAQTLINDLKDGYNTQLGKAFRHGEELSGGQWQKIALARAFYKNAQIVILDEPTSFIDPIDEDRIFNHIKEIAKDKIVILITHRIYNLKQADKIIVLDQGSIVESGHHTTLMSKKGMYADMFNSQK